MLAFLFNIRVSNFTDDISSTEGKHAAEMNMKDANFQQLINQFKVRLTSSAIPAEQPVEAHPFSTALHEFEHIVSRASEESNERSVQEASHPFEEHVVNVVSGEPEEHTVTRASDSTEKHSAHGASQPIEKNIVIMASN
jgi:hypothetical protein